MKTRHPEDALQKQLIDYWALQYPQTWQLAVHCPSGMRTSALQAAIFKRLGWKPGVPDLLCFARRGPWAGLAIELKAGRNKPSDAQAGWLDGLEGQGWRVGWFNGFDAARAFLDAFHQLPGPTLTQPCECCGAPIVEVTAGRVRCFAGCSYPQQKACHECGHSIDTHDDSGCVLEGCDCRKYWTKDQ